MNEVKKRGKALSKLGSNTELQAQKILKLTNDLLQTSRYFLGLLIALLDLLHDKLNTNYWPYFSEQNSYALLYYRNGLANNKLIKSSLKFYATKSEQQKNLVSVKNIFERYILKEFKDLRIHFAHRDADTRQELLRKGIYIIKVANNEMSYTLSDLQQIWEKYSSFFLHFKLLVARELFSDEDLISYVRKIPKPKVFHVFHGEIVEKKSDQT